MSQVRRILRVELDDNERLLVAIPQGLIGAADFVNMQLKEQGIKPGRLETIAEVDHGRGWTFFNKQNDSVSLAIKFLHALGYDLYIREQKYE